MFRWGKVVIVLRHGLSLVRVNMELPTLTYKSDEGSYLYVLFT
ncbi:hypothetical protein ALTERO38_80002 [Alteromonas sp. 38]|nr:hypothetical protein ALTER154_10607 [Alteromonas sp. 154]VXC38576.1 hypothetical protein ALTERO38_80002 [Alteromonas sp. 38]